MLTSEHHFTDNFTERSLIISCWRFTKISNISSVKFQIFFSILQLLISLVFLCQIPWNSNEWFSRNRCFSEKAIPHSIAISWLTTHALHLTGSFRRFFRLQIKIRELLGSLHRYPCFLTYLYNERLKLSIHCFRLWRKIARTVQAFNKYLVIAKWTACLLLQTLCALWILSARARTKIVFGVHCS